jgi:UDP-N-acetylmuramoyl-tripeptide--D-alanyl-D-alanine ligase
MALSLTQLAAIIGVTEPVRWSAPPPAIQGVAFHTADIQPGYAFFALPGATTHGIRFADAALAQGASLIISDQPHPQGLSVHDPARALLHLGLWARAQYRDTVIGITGSSGKTTTKSLMSAALNMATTPGNYNTPLALASTMANTVISPPKGYAPGLILELGIDRLGEMDELVTLTRPTHGVLTLIAPSHLDGLGDVATVAQQKGKLLEAAGYALASLQAYAHLSEPLQRKVATYGLHPEKATHLAHYDGGRLTYQTLTLPLPRPGQAMAHNALASLVMAEVLGVPLAVAAERLQQTTFEHGRLESHRLGNLTLLDDSYNSNPASAKEALAVLAEMPKPHAVILGDMLELGKESARYHHELGELTRGLDCVIAVGNHANDIQRGNPQTRCYATLEALLAQLPELPTEGTLLIKGSRGMRLERLVATLREAMT